MATTLCLGIKKNGSPCQGKGLEQYDGLCFAHGPADHIRAERSSLGGKNSATAVRLDKRIPQRLKQAIDLLEDGMVRVSQGLLSPSAYTAMCRGVKTLFEAYRLADEEAAATRIEEFAAAAAEITGVQADLDILEAAADIGARQDQFRRESLVDQGLAKPEEPSLPDQPPQAVLTEEGRRRFGYRRPCGYDQDEIDEVKEILDQYKYQHVELPELARELEAIEVIIEGALEDALLESAPPLDPLTGQPMKELPTGVTSGKLTESRVPDPGPSAEYLEDLLRQTKEQSRKVDDLCRDPSYDQKKYLYESSLESASDQSSTTAGKNQGVSPSGSSWR